jgi:hypothetical protein
MEKGTERYCSAAESRCAGILRAVDATDFRQPTTVVDSSALSRFGRDSLREIREKCRIDREIDVSAAGGAAQR